MPVVVGESSILSSTSSSSISAMAEQIRYRKPRNHSILSDVEDPDQNSPQIPSIIQSTRCKSSISSLLLSTFSPSTATATGAGAGEEPTTSNSTKKKYFTSATFRGLGCTAPSQVSVPAVIRTSASWEGKKGRKKKQKKNKAPVQPVFGANNNSPAPAAPPATSVASCLVVPDVWCGPGIGFSTDAASVDCVVSRRTGSGRGKIDGDKINLRGRPCTVRRIVNNEDISFFDHDPRITNSRMDVFGSRHHHHVRHRSPEGLAEIVMLQSSLLMGGRSDRLDRYSDWRLDVDSMSYEELLELGDRIGHVSTGLGEEEIIHCLRTTKLSGSDHVSTSQFPAEVQWKCSICQEEYEAEDEMGKLDCGHFYHIYCIKQWLLHRKTCPICKTSVVSHH